MVLPAEIAEPDKCGDCDVELVRDVHMSGAGYYIGTWCKCGPYARLSDYFPTREAALAELVVWNTLDVRPSARTPGYWGGEAL